MSSPLNESTIEALEQVGFPSYVYKDGCVNAVLEVWEHILEHGEGVRDEMWKDLVMNTDRPSPGRELCRKRGYAAKFRDWWWERVIVPGLQVVPEVHPVEYETWTTEAD